MFSWLIHFSPTILSICPSYRFTLSVGMLLFFCRPFSLGTASG